MIKEKEKKTVVDHKNSCFDPECVEMLSKDLQFLYVLEFFGFDLNHS